MSKSPLAGWRHISSDQSWLILSAEVCLTPTTRNTSRLPRMYDSVYFTPATVKVVSFFLIYRVFNTSRQMELCMTRMGQPTGLGRFYIFMSVSVIPVWARIVCNISSQQVRRLEVPEAPMWASIIFDAKQAPQDKSMILEIPEQKITSALKLFVSANSSHLNSRHSNGKILS